MIKYARIHAGIVVEVIETDHKIDDLYHPDIAASFMEVTDDVEPGWTYTDGKLAAPVVPSIPAPTLETVQADLKARIDKLAEVERLKYITGGVGQAMTYQQKAAEAIAYLAATNPVAKDYPLLSAEVGLTGKTLSDVATTVKAAFEQWQLIGAAVEKVRLGAKKAIGEAKTSEAAQAVFDAVVWPSA
ncbi:hypothetical protein FB480_103404 [Agrobacterium vitis]|nr:hypothetical protein FB480_103404 [Agrobacterium vitis]